MAAKASETSAGILVVLAVPFPESFVDYVFISALSLLRRRPGGGASGGVIACKAFFPAHLNFSKASMQETVKHASSGSISTCKKAPL